MKTCEACMVQWNLQYCSCYEPTKHEHMNTGNSITGWCPEQLKPKYLGEISVKFHIWISSRASRVTHSRFIFRQHGDCHDWRVFLILFMYMLNLHKLITDPETWEKYPLLLHDNEGLFSQVWIFQITATKFRLNYKLKILSQTFMHPKSHSIIWFHGSYHIKEININRNQCFSISKLPVICQQSCLDSLCSDTLDGINHLRKGVVKMRMVLPTGHQACHVHWLSSLRQGQ